MASIKKAVLKDGKTTRWAVRWKDPETRSSRERWFEREREAKAFARNLDNATATNTYVDPNLGKVTLAQWWERYQTTAAFQRTKPTTQDWYRTKMAHVIRVIGGRQVGSLRPMDIDAWLGSLYKQRVGEGTISGSFKALRAVLEAAVTAGILGKNPCKGVKAPSSIGGQEMRFLDVDEVDAMVQAVPDRYGALVEFMAWTGLRIGEAVAVTKESLDLEKGRVEVTQAYSEVAGRLILSTPKTKGSRRSVTLPKFLVQSLELHLTKYGYGNGGLVFSTENGHVIRRTLFRSRVWLPALKRAGLRDPQPRVHDLRHTAVALAIKVGAHPKEIQVRAGHSSIQVTMDRYGHLFEGQDVVLAERLDMLRSLHDGLTDTDANPTTTPPQDSAQSDAQGLRRT